MLPIRLKINLIERFIDFYPATVMIVMAPYLGESLSIISNKFCHVLEPEDVYHASNELSRMG